MRLSIKKVKLPKIDEKLFIERNESLSESHRVNKLLKQRTEQIDAKLNLWN